MLFNKEIDAFINNTLDDEELNDFLNHMKTCKSCSEELEVNYIVHEGMIRLEDKKASLNLAAAHKENLSSNIEYIKSRKKIITLSNVFRTIEFWTLVASALVFIRILMIGH